eukprot:3941558-Rhodomonas_salina.4
MLPPVLTRAIVLWPSYAVSGTELRAALVPAAAASSALAGSSSTASLVLCAAALSARYPPYLAA